MAPSGTEQVLTLKKLGIDDLVHFDFLDPPAPETMMPLGLGRFIRSQQLKKCPAIGWGRFFKMNLVDLPMTKRGESQFKSYLIYSLKAI